MGCFIFCHDKMNFTFLKSYCTPNIHDNKKEPWGKIEIVGIFFPFLTKVYLSIYITFINWTPWTMLWTCSLSFFHSLIWILHMVIVFLVSQYLTLNEFKILVNPCCWRVLFHHEHFDLYGLFSYFDIYGGRIQKAKIC